MNILKSTTKEKNDAKWLLDIHKWWMNLISFIIEEYGQYTQELIFFQIVIISNNIQTNTIQTDIDIIYTMNVTLLKQM